jgi:hypothetical protein
MAKTRIVFVMCKGLKNESETVQSRFHFTIQLR